MAESPPDEWFIEYRKSYEIGLIDDIIESSAARRAMARGRFMQRTTSTSEADAVTPSPLGSTAVNDLSALVTTLTRLQRLMGSLNAGLDLTHTMTAVAEGVVEGLGFGVAAISMVQPEGDLMVTVVAGSSDARQALEELRSPRSEWDRMLALATERGPSGALRLLSHDQADAWNEDRLPSWVPPDPDASRSGGAGEEWHPLDSLFAPLFSPVGELLAVLSVDLPPDGKRPNDELYALLELFAAQASTALDHAGLHTGLMAANEAARTALATRLQAVIDASPSAIVEVDREGLVTQWSRSAEEILGYGSRQVLGQSFPQQGDRVVDFAVVFEWLAAGGELPVVEMSWNRPDGVTVQLEISAGATYQSDGSVHGVMALLTDVTDRRRLEQEVQRQLTHDSLTGLANRSWLLDRFGEIMEGGSGCVAVMHIGLDGFREINDSLGHELGDQLLRAVSDRLAGQLRSGEAVARIAGDEFAVLIPNASDSDTVTSRCRDTLATLHQTFYLQDLPVDIEVSIGLAFGAHEGPQDVMRRADLAMHEAKKTSAGLVTLTADELSPPSGRVALLGELRRALEHDELVLHYQPQVDLRTGELCGVEALIRWHHPERGLLAPGAFLHVVENTGLVAPLTLFVLDAACAQLREWTDQHREIPIAVNLSARSLYDRHLVQQVRDALTRHGVKPALLRLEVTESAVMHDPQRALAVLAELARDGMLLSLDDFGTGFSSMSHLRHVPAHELKIDRSFVQDMVHDINDQVLVRSTIDLAHNLGLVVVAEGVEDAKTMEHLRELGCDVAQGFHIGRPTTVENLERWMTRRRIAGVPMADDVVR